MSTQAERAAISVEEYLRTSYEPDCEYEDGIVIERNVGETPHSWLQTALSAYLFRRRKRWNITALTEQRFRVRARKFMIPDVCVLEGPKPEERVISKPPLLWIEILSSEDRPVRVNKKVNDALAFGTPYVWVIDPDTLESYVATPEKHSTLEDRVLVIPGTEIVIPLGDLEED